MTGAAVLNQAFEWPDTTTEQVYECLPGKIAVKMCPPRKMYGELHLPDTLGGRSRADAGVVVSVGDPRQLQSGEYEVIPLAVGDKVYCRPYVGMFIQDGMHWIRFFGRECDETEQVFVPCWEHIVARDAPETEYGFAALGKNVLIERERRTSIIELLESYGETGTVVDGPESLFGRRVAIRRHSEDLLEFVYGTKNKSLALVPARDILTVIE